MFTNVSVFMSKCSKCWLRLYFG